jgi:aspartyl-tRNA(Asn)/glutamyl-tRNA(Gln) amidotransferase subunit A
MSRTPTLEHLAADLAQGRTTARRLVEECLARIDDPAGEGARAFTLIAREEARLAAEAIDKLRAAGAAPSRFAGIPISIKDLFDVRGQVTKGGSRALDDRSAAAEDAPSVARLRAAGFILIGRTNMTEFAFSGVGLNPHYGTPKCAFDRKTGRIPGGSSSGAAISVADGMAHVGLGTDTGGSCRIPAAYNGIVGFKPTASRVPTAGALPLSPTLDSIGPLARSVACCRAIDAILSGNGERASHSAGIRGLRIAAPRNYVLDGIDDHVGRDLERALAALSDAGALVDRLDVPEFDDIPRINAKAGFAAPEAFAWHEELIAKRGADYDPRVLVRINRGKEQSAVDYIRLLADRVRLIAAVETRLGAYDVIALPTVPTVAPPIAALDKDEDFGRINLQALRNPTVVNMIDGCAISLPMHAPGAAPTGLMLAALRGRDHALFSIAAAIEALIAARGA